MLDEPRILLIVLPMFVNLREIESLFFALVIRIQTRTILVDELMVLFQPNSEIFKLNPCKLTHLLPFLRQKTCTPLRFPRAVVVYDNVHEATIVVGSTRSPCESGFQQYLLGIEISVHDPSIGLCAGFVTSDVGHRRSFLMDGGHRR